MAENVILAEQTLAFAYEETFGCYTHHTASGFLHLTDGKTYNVVWDEAVYSCVAFTFDSGVPCHGLGNPIAVGGENNGAPFFFAIVIESGGASIFSFTTQASHTIAIYQVSDAVLPERTLDFLSANDNLYVHMDTPFVLEEGKTYEVLWDGERYLCTAGFLDNAVYIGNASIGTEGGQNIGEPFVAAWIADEQTSIIGTTEGESHTVAISEYTEQPPADIVVKDRNGNDVTHEGARRIRVRTDNDGTKEFLDTDLIPEAVETSVTLDFSSGDMQIVPSDGEVFSGVSIQKPSLLLPSNIADGIEIAGITGTMKAGASGTERITILPEQTLAPVMSNSEGCYKANFSPSESMALGTGYAVCFDGVWYIGNIQCKPVGLTSTVIASIYCFGNNKIMKKLYSSTIDWLASYEEPQPFLIWNNSLLVSDANQHTLRIDKIVISE